MQSQSVELRILLSWSDELTINTLLPLHRAFHVQCSMRPNSKYEDTNEILYRPSIVPGGGAEQVWGSSSPAPSPRMVASFPGLRRSEGRAWERGYPNGEYLYKYSEEGGRGLSPPH